LLPDRSGVKRPSRAGWREAKARAAGDDKLLSSMLLRLAGAAAPTAQV